MPSHLPAIIIITEKPVGAYCNTPLQNRTAQRMKSPSQNIGAIVRGFKSATTKQINQLWKTSGESVWQRNYYEHIIRNGDELNKIREYIMDNPLQWELDT